MGAFGVFPSVAAEREGHEGILTLRPQPLSTVSLVSMAFMSRLPVRALTSPVGAPVTACPQYSFPAPTWANFLLRHASDHQKGRLSPAVAACFNARSGSAYGPSQTGGMM